MGELLVKVSEIPGGDTPSGAVAIPASRHPVAMVAHEHG
jgi:hypothetical protein